jgi:hypothetical protein
MGGIGSGRSSRRRPRRDLVEHTLALDMGALSRAQRIVPGTAMSGWWHAATPVGGCTLSVTYDGDLTNPDDAALQLTFRLSGIDRHQTLSLVATRPHFGGGRIWFVCPVTRRRARVLYLPDGRDRFASRQAYGLGFRSQTEPVFFREIARALNIRARLGGDLSIHSPLPPRPRGMHRRTYERLRAEAAEIETRLLEIL